MAEYREFQDGELIAGTRYRVVKLIGVGGMGTVYEVEHTELGKRFVLKALLRELSRRQDLVIRLRNEWRALGRLEHPNIVTVTDAGTSGNGVPFYVMERLEGETLAQRMRRTRRFPVREAVETAVGVLEGLAAAHQIGVVHRDVKPPNIFLLHEGRPKVLDFGVAKIADDPGVVTARGVAVGTPRYMSPEQARGESVDGRADVYSTGLILFEIITGVSPYEDAKDANELILAHLARKAPRLSSLAMGVSPALDQAVAAMLGKSRDERPGSALEASKLLRDVLATGLVPPASDAKRASPPRQRESVNAPAKTSVNASPDTTRPDGVALRARPTATSVSVAGLSWLERPTLPQLAVEGSSADSGWGPGSRDNRASADTLIGLPPTEFPESLSPQVTDANPRVNTEILTAIPLPEPEVTRTMAPERHPSETPPPVSPMPEAAAPAPPQKTRRALWAWSIPVVLGLVVAVVATRTPAPASAPRAAVPSEPLAPVPARTALPSAPAQPAITSKVADAPPPPPSAATASSNRVVVGRSPAPAATESPRNQLKSKTSSARAHSSATTASSAARSGPKPHPSAVETPQKAVQAALPSSGL